MAKRKLRAVQPGERAPRPKKITSILDATENGTRLDELIMMRRRIARVLDLDDTPPRDLASLTRRQVEISREIEALQRQADEEATHDADTSDEEWSAEAI